MEEWETEASDKPIPVATTAQANKWEGEDEDDDVKDNWEDEEEEEKKDVEKQEAAGVKPAAAKKSKKNLAERIEEKERLQKEDLQRRAKEMEAKVALTPEAQAAEKLRRQKLQEESDLRLTLETFGIAEAIQPIDGGIDSMNPSSKEEFDALAEALSKKVQSFSKSPLFSEFSENLVRTICANLSSVELKRLKTVVENMFIEKSKIEKGDKAKKTKGKGKAKLKMDGENSVNDYSTYGDYHDDLDDFM